MEKKELIKIASEVFELSIEDIESNCTMVEEVNALFFSETFRGGGSILVANDGTYLYWDSSIGYDTGLQEFKNGRRSKITDGLDNMINEMDKKLEDINHTPEIKELVENSKLPYELLSDYETFDKTILSQYKLISNYMSFDYRFKDTNEIALRFAGYPNDESKMKLVEITLNNENYNVFGIKVGDISKSIQQLDLILSKYNYEGLESTYSCSYKNGKVTITFEFNNDLIKSINIRISSKVLGNRLY